VGTTAILGATSQLAQDYILHRSRNSPAVLHLYARNLQAVYEFLSFHNLESRHRISAYADIAATTHENVMNFIGVSSPIQAREMGAGILAVTTQYDDLVLAYLSEHPQSRYIFLSSGAAYGEVFDKPADNNTASTFPLSKIESRHYYGIAKFYAEVRHRSRSASTIVDIRVFNYVSRTMNPAAGFLLSSMVSAVMDGKVFYTDSRPLIRDFVHPSDLGNLLDAALACPPGTNLAVDAYSAAPITKLEILGLMAEKFGMRFEIVPTLETIDATGIKPHYYSLNTAAAKLGYKPQYDSASAIMEEVTALLREQGR